MSSGSALPRVLVNPKLHRRHTAEPFAKQESGIVKEFKKHKCPPIDPKQCPPIDPKQCPPIDQKQCPPIDQKQGLAQDPKCMNLLGNKLRTTQIPGKECNDVVHSPLSPADGVSPACAAMATACSHDHDYLSMNGSVNDSSKSINHLEVGSNAKPFPSWPDNKITIRVPMPPKPPTQKSPRDVSVNCEAGPRNHRRLVRPSTEHILEMNESDPARINSSNGSCVFVSTSRTAQPLRKPRSRRKVKVSNDENIFTDNEHVTSSSSSRSASTNCSDVISLSNKRHDENFNDFDIATDKLTVEWQNMVQKYLPTMGVFDEDSDDEVGQPMGHSTPMRNDEDHDTSIPLPRPSMTPCPPDTLRLERNKEQEDRLNKNDSAYFSLTNSSVSSIAPNEVAVSTSYVASNGSRPSTGPNSAPMNRPPSGGKRVAATSLSSSSSCASSDEDSVCSSLSSQKMEKNSSAANYDEDVERHIRSASADSLRLTKESSSQEHKVVKLRKGKRFVRQIDVSKTKRVVVKPPLHLLSSRKPKKDPLPMNHRALPSSFFQEPNRVNLSSCNTLPPLQPLFRQPSNDDIADLRPVTPPDQKRPQNGHEENHDQTKKVVIRRGDTDLLNRLFDAVDPQCQPAARPVKRGRPKRPQKLLPPPKLTLDDNPCIMQSITNTLFPNLSIEKRKSRHLRTHVASMVLGADPVTHLNHNTESPENFDFDRYENELSQFGFLSFNSSNYDDESVDSPIPPSSLSTQRHETLALPQLPLNQDFSQMLTDVAAVL